MKLLRLKNTAPEYDVNGNYCSMSPDKLFGCNYNYACYVHDRQYRDEVVNRQSRFVSDLALWKNIVLECWKVRKTSIIWSCRVGFIYFFFVRLFGAKNYKHKASSKKPKR